MTTANPGLVPFRTRLSARIFHSLRTSLAIKLPSIILALIMRKMACGPAIILDDQAKIRATGLRRGMSNNCMERSHGGEEEDVPGFLIFALYINNPIRNTGMTTNAAARRPKARMSIPSDFGSSMVDAQIARNAAVAPPISMIFFPRSKSRHSAPETLVSSRYSSKSMGMLLSPGVASYPVLTASASPPSSMCDILRRNMIRCRACFSFMPSLMSMD